MKLSIALSVPLCVIVCCLAVGAAQSAADDAIFTVNDTLDLPDSNPGNSACAAANGHCTLRAAIMEANALYAAHGGQYTITLPSSGALGTTYPLTATGANEDAGLTGDLDIQCACLLQGSGAVAPTIDAAGLGDRVIDILSTITRAVTVTIDFVRIAHGTNTYGGGIFAHAGPTTLDHVTVISNTSNGFGGWGGGIDSSGTLIIRNSTLRANMQQNGQGGGGLSALGTTIIDNSSIVSNTVRTITTTGAVNSGGGILLFAGSLALNNSQVLSNVINLSSTVSSYASGGGIAVSGPATITASTIRNNLVHGDGLVSVSGGGVSAGADVRLSGDTVENNRTTAVGYTIFGSGGGIQSSQQLWLTDTVVSANQSAYGGGIQFTLGRVFLFQSSLRFNHAASGGGIDNAGGTLQIADSTLNSNSAAGNGGGIYNDGSLTMTNSTLSFNLANGDGGGLYDDNYARLDSDTFSVNIADADDGGGGDGGGIFIPSGKTLNLHDTLLAGNIDLSSSGNNFAECAGTLNSLDYNLILTTTGCTRTNLVGNNIYGQNPNLQPLADNGGPTQTHALPAGSAAIDKGDPNGCKDAFGQPLTFDQRGHPRLGRCDIGAYEFARELFLPAIRR